MKTLVLLAVLALGLAGCAPERVASHRCAAQGLSDSTPEFWYCWDRVKHSEERKWAALAAIDYSDQAPVYQPPPFVHTEMAMPSMPTPAPMVALPYPVVSRPTPLTACIGVVPVPFAITPRCP